MRQWRLGAYQLLHFPIAYGRTICNLSWSRSPVITFNGSEMLPLHPPWQHHSDGELTLPLMKSNLPSWNRWKWEDINSCFRGKGSRSKIKHVLCAIPQLSTLTWVTKMTWVAWNKFSPAASSVNLVFVHYTLFFYGFGFFRPSISTS